MEKTDDDRSRWSGQDTEDFVDSGEIFVPHRHLQMRILRDLVPNEGTIIDLCCGEGILADAILRFYPETHVIALDGEDQMLQRAASRNSIHGTRFCAKKLLIDDFNGWEELPHANAVVSSLAIHHLDEHGKRYLFKCIYDKLYPTGILLIADLIQPHNELGSRLAAKLWDEQVQVQSQCSRGDLSGWEKFRHLNWNHFSDPSPDEIDMPSPLLSQLKWLEDVGFRDVDVFWLFAGHAIFGGWKR